MKEAISSIVMPVSLIEAWTLESKFRLPMEATRGESFGFVGDMVPDGVLEVFWELPRRDEIGRIGSFCALLDSSADWVLEGSDMEGKVGAVDDDDALF